MSESQRNIGRVALDKLGQLVPFRRGRDLRVEPPEVSYRGTPIIYFFRSMVTKLRQANELAAPGDRTEALAKALEFGVLVLKTPATGAGLLREEFIDLKHSDPQMAKSAEAAIKTSQTIIQTYPDHYFKRGRLFLQR